MFRFLRKQDQVNILRYLPAFLAKDEEFKEIAGGCSAEHEKIRLQIIDLAKQFFVETATWGLDDWERVLAITTAKGDSYPIRRNRILLKLQGCQTSTIDFMKTLISRYVEEESDVRLLENNQENTFKILLKGAILDLSGLFEAVNTYKPAHLGFNVTLKRESELNYHVGLLNATIGKKRIGLPPPPPSKNTISVGIAQMQIGRKKISISPPEQVKLKLYTGQYVVRTGRISIGGTR